MFFLKLGEIIKKFRDEHKLSMDKFAEQSGLTKGYISMLEKNEHPKSKKPIIPTEETLIKVAKGMGVDIEVVLNNLDENQEIQINTSPQNMIPSSEELLRLDRELHEPRHSEWISHGEKLLAEQTAEQNKVEDSKDTVDNIIQFPKLFSYDYYDQPASAGTGQYLNDVQVETIELPVEYDADFVIPIYGDSMEPEYHSGDYVFVKLSVDLSDGDIGVFEYYGDAYVKQLVINESGAFLHSLNDKYDDIPVDADSDFRIIGEVVGIYREG